MSVQFSKARGAVVDSQKRVVVINGRVIPFHPEMKGESITMVDGKPFIDGYELKRGKWKKTLRAACHKYS
ncbi:hypothetical protein [Bacillus sp. JZ34]